MTNDTHYMQTFTNCQMGLTFLSCVPFSSPQKHVNVARNFGVTNKWQKFAKLNIHTIQYVIGDYNNIFTHIDLYTCAINANIY